MTAIRFLVVFAVFGLAEGLHAQIVDARESLVFPVNPPQSARGSSAPQEELERQLALHALVVETVQEIDRAQASGFGSGHPKMKALQAKLAAVQKQVQGKPARPALPQSLASQLAQSEARHQEKEAALSREVAALKAEVAQLREELKKAQK